MISPLMESCAQATLVEDCFSNFVNMESFNEYTFEEIRACAKFIWFNL
jgi:hypothetical protein